MDDDSDLLYLDDVLLEEGDELDVLDTEPKRRVRRPPKDRPKGVPTVLAGEARRRAIAEASGRNVEPSTGSDWRDQLAQGNRSGASSALDRGGRRGSGSGFGLA